MKSLYNYILNIVEDFSTPLNVMGMGNPDPINEPLIIKKKKHKKSKQVDPKI